MRMGLHFNTMRQLGKAVDYVRRVKPPYCLTLDFNRPAIERLKAAHPGLKMIGRVYDKPQTLGATGSRWVREVLLPTVREHPEIDYWEGYNEVGVFDLPELARYAEMEVERVQLLADARARAVIGNTSTGVLGASAVEVMAPLFAVHDTHDSLWGVHQYSGPYMQWMCGANQWDHDAHCAIRIDDPCLSTDVRGYCTLRHRHWVVTMHDHGFQPRIVITEGGIDDVRPRPGYQGKGWKDYRHSAWARIPGIGDYADQQHWCYRQLSHDNGGPGRSLVMGGVDFGWGTEDPAWNSFDLSTSDADEMRERVIARMQELPEGHYGAVEPPPELPRHILPMTEVRHGDTWWEIARVLLRRDEVTRAEVEELRAHNRDVVGLEPGAHLRSPWHVVVGATAYDGYIPVGRD